MPRALRSSSRLRDLLPTHLSKLCLILDPLHQWKELAAKIKNRNGIAMFNTDQMLNIELHTEQSGRSACREVITSWYTDNPTIGHLYDILIEIRALRAANYLRVEVLKCFSQSSTSFPPPYLPYNIPPACHLDTQFNDGNAYLSDGSYTTSKVQDDDVSTTIAKERLADDDSSQIPTQSLTYDMDISPTEPVLDSDQHITQQGCVRLRYELLRQATNDFNYQPFSDGGNLLGEGGFGQVFKGDHPDYPVLAVKKFNISLYDNNPLAKQQFMTEISVLSRCKHENLLPLVGFCDEGPLCVVYEYMSNGSLEDCLACKNSNASLSVSTRLDIIKGVARGLNYLHHLSPVLIHRDIKSANILLNEQFTAKIGDCGTVREGPHTTLTHTITQTAIGTHPYMPKEYLEENEVSVKMDAYSFGVLLLEILTGLPVLDPKREDSSLPTHVREMTDTDEDIIHLLDPSAGKWGVLLPVQIYKMTQKFLEFKRRRLTIAEALVGIEMCRV